MCCAASLRFLREHTQSRGRTTRWLRPHLEGESAHRLGGGRQMDYLLAGLSLAFGRPARPVRPGGVHLREPHGLLRCLGRLRHGWRGLRQRRRMPAARPGMPEPCRLSRWHGRLSRGGGRGWLAIPVARPAIPCAYGYGQPYNPGGLGRAGVRDRGAARPGAGLRLRPGGADRPPTRFALFNAGLEYLNQRPLFAVGFCPFDILPQIA